MAHKAPTPAMILAYAAGELAADQRAEVEDHLKRAPAAARSVEWYRSAAAAFRSDQSVQPPSHVLERAKAILKHVPKPKSPSWLDRLDAIIAHLVYDSRLQPAGVRYAGSPLQVQLSYEIGDIVVDVQVQRQSGGEKKRSESNDAPGGADQSARWMIVGQVSMDHISDAACMTVRLVDRAIGQSVVETQTDDSAMFELAAQPGDYDLCVELAAGVLVLPEIDLT